MNNKLSPRWFANRSSAIFSSGVLVLKLIENVAGICCIYLFFNSITKALLALRRLP